MATILGIDFGSSLCRTAMFRDGQVESFPNRFSERKLPVIVEDSRGGVSFTSIKQSLGFSETPAAASELFEAIRQATGAEEPTKPGEAETNTILDRVQGDAKLARKMARMFLADSGPMMGRIRQALAQGDAEALRLAAHALKGSVGNFSTTGAYEGALEIENLARREDFSSAGRAFQDLEAHMARLTGTLNALGRRRTAVRPKRRNGP